MGVLLRLVYLIFDRLLNWLLLLGRTSSYKDVELLVPYNQGALLHEIHEIAGELDREDRPEGVKVAARLPKVVAERYDRYALNGQPSD